MEFGRFIYGSENVLVDAKLHFINKEKTNIIKSQIPTVDISNLQTAPSSIIIPHQNAMPAPPLLQKQISISTCISP
jgi:hypothetical protein